MYKIQILHPESGLYLNTNHRSGSFLELKKLLETAPFAGPQFQIVDDENRVRYGPVCRERSGEKTVEDVATSFGVLLLGNGDWGFNSGDGE